MFEKLVSNTCYLDSNALLTLSQGLTKSIPGTPEGQTPIHEVANPIHKRIQK